MQWTYQKGLHDLGNGAYAWLAPDGSWGWSNAGLIVDGEQSLLVDTLFDLRLTQEMLDAMRDAEPRAAGRIGTLVNTHANGDHCHGNQLVEGAEIIASVAAAEEMLELPPEAMAALMKAMAGDQSPLGRFFRKCFGPFEFEGIRHTPPTRVFEGEATVRVGDKTVELIQVGPAHTRGDVLVHVPGDRTVFTGDILFIDGTPIMWAGPVQNWIDACGRIVEMGVETVVPGHGPITDERGVEAVRGYLEYVRDETRKRYDAGMDAFEAARDIALGDYASWGDAERIVVNVDRLYREFSGDETAPDVPTLFSQMAELAGSRP
jgi:glyoxylase-like metal-dependent hydrolase (beta-lactamase superfamily II)